MKTCERIKKIRKEKGFTQKILGEKTGIAESTIRRYEIGLLNPKLETIKKIANALEVGIAELLGEEFGEMTVNKTAKEMFEELGYKQVDSYPGAITYEKEWMNGIETIEFDPDRPQGIDCRLNGEYTFVSTNVLKVITKQAEELGWLDE